MDGPIVCIIIGVMFTIIILGFIGMAGDYMKYKHTDALQAKPVTTEIPEYTMKCTVFEDICKEYTIYRITRN